MITESRNSIAADSHYQGDAGPYHKAAEIVYLTVFWLSVVSVCQTSTHRAATRRGVRIRSSLSSLRNRRLRRCGSSWRRSERAGKQRSVREGY